MTICTLKVPRLFNFPTVADNPSTVADVPTVADSHFSHYSLYTKLLHDVHVSCHRI